jgi:hypothetical protein
MGKFIAALAAVLFITATPAGAQQQMPFYATQVLVGTWQLVKFQDSNGTVIRPDKSGQLHARLRRQGAHRRTLRLQSRQRHLGHGQQGRDPFRAAGDHAGRVPQGLAA